MPEIFSLKFSDLQDNICVPHRTQVSKSHIAIFPSRNTVEEAGFIYERADNPNKFLHKASDGQYYNLKEIILTRISFLIDNIQQKAKQSEKSIYKNIEQILADVEKAKDIDKLFESQTGFTFSPENVEKFLKGEIKIKIEKEFTKITGIKLSNIPIPPYINENRLSDAEKQKLDKSRKNLTPEEKTKFDTVKKFLNEKYQKMLNKCLISGKLLQSNSDNNSTVLDNFYKILTQPRAKEFDKTILIKECLDILNNPYRITQITEDIPNQYLNKFIPFAEGKNISEKKEFLSQREAGACVAASIEYYMATEHTAEFFRMVEGLTSHKKEVSKKINCAKTDLTDDVIAFFKTQYEIKNGNLKVTIRADKNAYKLAEMQKRFQDEDERSAIDIIMQSLAFQIGTGNSYNSITDKHNSIFNKSGDGMCANEENYTLKILTGNDIICNIYRELDEISTKDTIYQTESQIIKDIDNALNLGKKVLFGFFYSFDEKTQTCQDGHEVTIIDKITVLDGTDFYICKNTAEELNRPVAIDKKFLISHALNINIEK